MPVTDLDNMNLHRKTECNLKKNSNCCHNGTESEKLLQKLMLIKLKF